MKKILLNGIIAVSLAISAYAVSQSQLNNLLSDNTSSMLTLPDKLTTFYNNNFIQPIAIDNKAVAKLGISGITNTFQLRQEIKKREKVLANNLDISCYDFDFADKIYTKVTNNNNCFNIVDLAVSSSGFIIKPTIGTKIAGEPFILRMDRIWSYNKECWRAYDVNFTLVDLDDNNKTISSTQTTFPLMQFRVDKAYKNVAVKIQYKLLNKFGISCLRVVGDNYIQTYSKSWNTTDWSWNNLSNYKINKSLVAYCYRKTSEVVTEYSLDNFAIRPEKFNLNIKQSEVRAKENPKIELNATNADGVISTNYSTSSANLTLIPTNNKTKLAYAFDIVNGKVRNYRLFFTKPADDVAISIKEKIGKEWAIVDADDTVDSCRLITGKSNEVDVIDGTKNWAGVGVDNSYNDPNTNNVNTDIRQNVNKDLHFHKMSW
jgi:hypothetical protein